MSTKAFLLTGLLILMNVFAPSAFAEKPLQGSEFLFRSLAETFPEFMQQGKGVQEITLLSLECYSLNEIVAGAHVLKTRCHAIAPEFKHSEVDAGPLFLTMINLRLKVHNYSSPGITYVNVRDLKCIKNAKEARCTVREAWN